jgi:hypothetical protein
VSKQVTYPGVPYAGSDRKVLRRILATLRRMRDRAKDERTGLHAFPSNVRLHASVAAGHVEGMLREDDQQRSQKMRRNR